MATFKVGQRVRIIQSSKHPDNVGREGVITHDLWMDPHCSHSYARGRLVYNVALDGHPHAVHGTWGALPEQLAPLTDPKADEFIEGLKKLAREPQPALLNTGPAIHV